MVTPPSLLYIPAPDAEEFFENVTLISVDDELRFPIPPPFDVAKFSENTTLINVGEPLRLYIPAPLSA